MTRATNPLRKSLLPLPPSFSHKLSKTEQKQSSKVLTTTRQLNLNFLLMLDPVLFSPYISTMLKILNKRIKSFCSRIQWPIRRCSKPKLVIKRLAKSNSKPKIDIRAESFVNGDSNLHENAQLRGRKTEKPIRIATFNAALFSMAPAVPLKTGKNSSFHFDVDVDLKAKFTNGRPKSILKQSPLHPNSMNGTENVSKEQKFVKSKLRVSINLPENEISLLRNRQSSFREEERKEGFSISKSLKEKASLRPTASFPASIGNRTVSGEGFRSSRTVLEVLKELDADILALQDVKAEEEKGMKPLSDLAAALGMNYVFAESWAPEYGNAILSRWPIKRWKVQKIFDDSDFRNVLRATIDVPQIGEVNFHCTHLDHLDENWRMKQINAIIQSSDGPHILAGGLNSLDEADYSTDRWTDIVKYYEEIGKPTPKAKVMKFLKTKQYVDSKDYAGDYEAVVMIAKGQSVQGTCKYGTRLDYILTSPDSPYKFIPGSYVVFSSKGTSDHHIVKVDIVKISNGTDENVTKKPRQQSKKNVVKIQGDSPSRGIWKTHN